MRQYRYMLRRVREATVCWRCRGGAGIEFAEENVASAQGARIAILMIGGNDIANGMSPRQLADRVSWVATQMVDTYGVDAVSITSLWPRRDPGYNARARQYAELMEQRFQGDPQIVFWLWDRRQPWRNYDGVHFYDHGYYRAMTYLVAVIVWTIHHNQW